MFESLLIGAVAIAIFLAFYFLRSDSSDSQRIITKLESLDKAVFEGQEENEFKCVLSHVHDSLDQIFVFPSPENETGSKPMGSVPYTFKSRILHYLNTANYGYKAVFNKSTEKLTIDLIKD